MSIIDEIETGNIFRQDGLDYYMDCTVVVNNVRTRCEQVSIVYCDLSNEGRSDREYILELRRGNFITWIFLEDIESLEVSEKEK